MLLVHISDSKLIFQICIEWQKSESGLIAEGSWILFLFWFSVWWRFWMIVVEPERLYDMNGQCWCEFKWEFEILIDCVLYTRNNLKQNCDACYVQSLDLPIIRSAYWMISLIWRHKLNLHLVLIPAGQQWKQALLSLLPLREFPFISYPD